jgi:hypothetical protein
MAWDRVIGGKAKGPDLDPADRGSESPKTEAALRVQGLDARSAIWIRSGDARPGREARAEQRVLALADDCFEDELVRGLVEEENRRRLRPEDGASDLDDRRQQRAERLLRADHSGCHCCT